MDRRPHVREVRQRRVAQDTRLLALRDPKAVEEAATKQQDAHDQSDHSVPRRRPQQDHGLLRLQDVQQEPASAAHRPRDPHALQSHQREQARHTRSAQRRSALRRQGCCQGALRKLWPRYEFCLIIII